MVWQWKVRFSYQKVLWTAVIKNNKILVVPPGGTSVVSTEDCIEGIMVAHEKAKSGDKFIFSNEYLTFKELFTMIADAHGQRKIMIKISKCFYLPLKKLAVFVENFLAIFGKKTNFTPQWVDILFKYRYYNSAKARRVLGWIPRCTIQQAIKDAVAFYNALT